MNTRGENTAHSSRSGDIIRMVINTKIRENEFIYGINSIYIYHFLQYC